MALGKHKLAVMHTCSLSLAHREEVFLHRKSIISHSCKHRIPSILYALLDEYCLLIFSGKTMPWYLSMAMQVIVRMPVTMAVVCTKGTVLQTRTPAGKKQRDDSMRYCETTEKHAFVLKYASRLLFDQRWGTEASSSPSLSSSRRVSLKKQNGRLLLHSHYTFHS